MLGIQFWTWSSQVGQGTPSPPASTGETQHEFAPGHTEKTPEARNKKPVKRKTAQRLAALASRSWDFSLTLTSHAVRDQLCRMWIHGNILELCRSLPCTESKWQGHGVTVSTLCICFIYFWTHNLFCALKPMHGASTQLQRRKVYSMDQIHVSTWSCAATKFHCLFADSTVNCKKLSLHTVQTTL